MRELEELFEKETKIKATYKTIFMEERAYEPAYTEWLEEENKELVETLEELINVVAPEVYHDADNKPRFYEYEEVEMAKEVLEKYIKEE